MVLEILGHLLMSPTQALYTFHPDQCRWHSFHVSQNECSVKESLGPDAEIRERFVGNREGVCFRVTRIH